MTSEQHLKCEIGTIPPDWNVNKLSDLVDKIKSGGTPTSTKKEYYGGDIPFVKIEDITASNRYLQATKISISDEGLNSSNAWLVPEGSLLYSIYATVGEVIINQVPVATNQAIMGIIPNKKVETDYLYYFLQGIKNKLSIYFKETTQKNLTAEIVKNFRIGLPPLPEQHKIASILSKVDEHISHTEAIIEKTEELKKGLMQQLLTKGIGHTKFKKTEIGEIPEEWDVVKLVDVSLNLLGGGTPSTANNEYWDGSIPWMTSAHINGRYIRSGQKYITQKGLEQSSTKLIPKENILFVTRVGVGKIAINLIDIAISQDITGIIIDKEKANIGFIYWKLLDVARKIVSLSQGSTIKGILKSDLANQNVALPPLSEQTRIANMLMKIETNIEQNQTYLSHLQELKKGLMQDLLTGKVRVTV